MVNRLHISAMREFTTAGPVRPEVHYCMPPLERVDPDGSLALIRGRHRSASPVRTHGSLELV